MKGASRGFRDYSLTGPEGRGQGDDEWYTCPIPRQRLKALMRRDDRTAIANYALWLGLLLASGIVAWLSWDTWYAFPAFLVYGILYASCADSRWHECAHGTPFRTRWLNEACYHLVSFMALKEPHVWRWSHTRHHSHTIVVGRDPEIAFPRPPDLLGMVANLLHLKTGPKELAKIVRHGFGRLSADERDFLPEGERAKVFRVARIWLLILLAVAGVSIARGR